MTEQTKLEAEEVIERSTPRRNRIELLSRTNTNDGAIAQGILGEDEYRLADLHLEGWAIDVGAHIGTIGIALAVDNPDLRVVMVEALPDNARLCSNAVARNGLTERVFVESAGATSEDIETVEVTYNFRSVTMRGGGVVDPQYLSQCRYVGNVFEPDKLHEQDNDTVTVPGVSLGAILRRYDIDRVALLKIDCEGCEWQFFTSPHIGRVDRIVGEYHDAKEFRDLRTLLEPTHIVQQWTTGTVGLFGAVRIVSPKRAA